MIHNISAVPRSLTIYLLALVTITFCGCGGIISGPTGYEKFKRDEDAFVKAIRDAGGKASKESKSMFGVHKTGWLIDLSGATVSDQLIAHMVDAAKLNSIFQLNLSDSTITNDQLAELDNGKALERTVELDLRNTGITDDGLDKLSNLCWISTLNLKGSSATKLGAKKLEDKKIANPDTPIPFKKQINTQT